MSNHYLAMLAPDYHYSIFKYIGCCWTKVFLMFCCSVAGLWRWRFAQNAKSISVVQAISSLKGILQLRGMALAYSLCYVNDWKHFANLPSDWLTSYATKRSPTLTCVNLMITSNHAIFWFVELIVPWQVICLAILVLGPKVLLQNGTCHL